MGGLDVRMSALPSVSSVFSILAGKFDYDQ